MAGSLITVLDSCLIDGYGDQLPVGWTKPFTGTNLAVYKMPVGSLGCYLRVDDTGVTTDGCSYIRGYEDMTDVNTGTNAFPTVASLSNGYSVWKSSAVDSTPREWMLFSNGTIFYLYINPTTAYNGYSGNVYPFGEFLSYRQNDMGRCFISGGPSSHGAVASLTFSSLHTTMAAGLTSRVANRSYTQATGAANIGFSTDSAKNGTAVTMGTHSSSGLSFPNPADGSLCIAPIWLHELNAVRGELPGVWCPLHAKALSHMDTFVGSGVLSGRTFINVNLYNLGQCCIETSNTW
jgi:hypothetical protein